MRRIGICYVGEDGILAGEIIISGHIEEPAASPSRRSRSNLCERGNFFWMSNQKLGQVLAEVEKRQRLQNRVPVAKHFGVASGTGKRRTQEAQQISAEA